MKDKVLKNKIRITICSVFVLSALSSGAYANPGAYAHTEHPMAHHMAHSNIYSTTPVPNTAYYPSSYSTTAPNTAYYPSTPRAYTTLPMPTQPINGYDAYGSMGNSSQPQSDAFYREWMSF